MNMLTPLLLALFALFSPLLGASETQDMDSIVAVVNDDVIVRSELDQEIKQILTQLRARGTQLPPQPILERQVLERVIQKRLQLQAAERLGIQVDDTSLGRAVDNIAKKNKLDLAQLRATLEKEGISFAQFRESTRRQILLARLQAQEVTNRISVTDQEIQNFLSQDPDRLNERSEVHLMHILVATPEGATPEVSQRARDQAEHIVQDIRGGADFAATALRYSDGRQALEGGDMGWVKMSQVPSLIKDQINNMEKGAVTDPIRSASGFHVFRLMDYKGGARQVITQTHARHILLKTNELISDQEARTRLEQIRIRLVGGDDFATLARAHSEDATSAIRGGDLGWLSPGDTVPEFEQQIKELASGEISQPFHTQFGWHLVQVLEQRSHDSTDEILKSRAQEAIRERKTNEETELWLRRLRDEAYVEILLKTPEQ